MTEDEMGVWHHQLDGHELAQALGVGDGQGSLCGAVHGVTESDMTKQLNCTAKLLYFLISFIRSQIFTAYIVIVCMHAKN